MKFTFLAIFSFIISAQPMRGTITTTSDSETCKESTFSKMNRECQKTFTKSYIGNQAPLLLQNNKEAIKEVNQNFGSFISNMLSANKDCVDCSTGNFSNVSNFFSAHSLTDLERKADCMDLNPGQNKVVNRNAFTSPTGTRMKYALKRIDKRNYLATLNLNFVDKFSGDKVTSEIMHTRVKQCLRGMGKFMNSSDNRNINFSILTNTEAQSIDELERPPRIDINISESGGRANSMTYPSQIDCPTITHEVMHLLGLVDEYEEKSDFHYVDSNKNRYKTSKLSGEALEALLSSGKIKKVYDYKACRSVSKKESLMSDHREITSNGLPRQIKCSCRNSVCNSVIKKQNPVLLNLYTQNHFYLKKNIERDKYCKVTKVDKINNKKIHLDRDLKGLKFANIHKLKDEAVDISFLKFQNPGIFDTGKVKLLAYNMKCSCKESDSSCIAQVDKIKTIIKKIKEKKGSASHCPWGAIQDTNHWKMPTEPKNAQFIHDGFTITVIPKKIVKTLLRPSHFERIINGACQKKSTQYSRCAKYAYRAMASQCKDRPKECSDPTFWQESTK